MYLSGMGAAPGAFSTQCGGGLDALNSDCWANIWGLSWLAPSAPKPVLAPPRVPSNLTMPPASGESADATVQALVDQQMRDQQALNAAQVKSTWVDEILGDAAEVGDAAGNAATAGLQAGMTGLVWVAIGLGAFALVALSAGGPRRYGR